MALTYKLIASTITTTNTGPVSFTSIPDTYTDLVLKLSVRSSASATGETVWLQINDDTSISQYQFSRSRISNASITKDGSGFSNAQWFASSIANSGMASMFTAWEIYIPEYKNTGVQKQALSDNSFPSNNSDNASEYFGYAWNSTAAINKITVKYNGPNFQAGSAFFLYGITKS
jgi:hypothetical protein